MNSATSKRPSAIKPMPNRLDGVGGMPRRRTIHCAARMITTRMMGVSISSAVLVPKRGTNHSVQMGPSTKPAPNTKANLHDSLLPLSAPGVVLTEDFIVKPNGRNQRRWFTASSGQMFFRISLTFNHLKVASC